MPCCVPLHSRLFALITVVVTSACGSLFGIGDLPPLQEKPASEDGGTPSGEGGVSSDARATGRDGSNVLPGGADPRWAQWRMPGDEPPASDFTIENHPDGVVVTDLVTGLVWQDQVAKEKRRIADSIAYCEALAYGGFDDWRLPTRIELVSLMTFTSKGLEFQPSSMSPVDDTGPSYWTSSIVHDQDPVAAGWTIENSGARRRSDTEIHYARCVRGAAPLGKHTIPSYNLDALTVRDPRTALVWERDPPDDATSFGASTTRCAALTLRGKTARVPTVKELLTIVDEEDISPLTPAPFGEHYGDLWSTTETTGYRWYLRLADGTAQNTTSSSVNRVRCVAPD